MNHPLLRSLLLLTVGALLIKPTAAAEAPVVFVTSFAGGDKGAINAYQLQTATGGLKPLHRTTGVEHPFFIAVSRDRRFLYSIHAKTFGGKEPEQVAAYALEGRTGRMTLLNRQSTRGTASCYLDVDATGRTVLVANYTTGNVASFPVRADGSLGEAASFFQHTGSSVDLPRQKGPNAHSFVVSPDNRYALAADLGIDQILSYRLDAATAKLTPNQPPFTKAPPGAGPRHLTFHPNGRHVYVINELKNSVTRFDYAVVTGTLTERETISTLPVDFTGRSYCADLKITPNGRFLYGTNRGHDSIAAYRIGEDGRLTLLEIEPSLGKGPQNLLITGGGELLLCANMPGNNLAVFRIDAATGGLKSVGEPLAVPSPSCIRLLP
ncbi:MAG: 6-phosphogluconolactonase [Limisphaerales bacterium]|nr:MAG: 6-phosphogluconolactonase [Limisphaerales bacterium]KAG0509386.1 MAG: 6-phosphogluconolactonase [Limisphaerales bacterium]TXT52131.1 MAG: 6-phosphogluconolactonase [Limisphaerales bacterium]